MYNNNTYMSSIILIYLLILYGRGRVSARGNFFANNLSVFGRFCQLLYKQPTEVNSFYFFGVVVLKETMVRKRKGIWNFRN